MAARFVRLTITGFKSFADPAALEILPGLTGIVGPNGCGKSNVAEALRWAMGEANARHLRGGEMDDIIFAGTANRPSRNLAEVTLTVEDEEAGLPPPFSAHAELQVTRRIARGEGSVYKVNGREARARDVQTLFADLASGARSSAMVSQGRVGSLVNARPEDRRAVLEEAAGITGLHARRGEAEARLRATEANLERAGERLAHMLRQLDGLAEQARQAARYRTVSTAMLDSEASLLAIQRSRAEDALATARAALARAKQQVEDAARAAEAADLEVARNETGLPDLRENERRAAAIAERAKMSLEVVAAELARAEAALTQAEQRKGQLVRDLAHAEATLLDAETIDTRLAGEAARLETESLAYPALLKTARQEVLGASDALRYADEAAAETAAQASAASTQAAAVAQALQSAEARHSRAADSMARIEADRAQAETRIIGPDRLHAAQAASATAAEAARAARAALAQAESGLATAARGSAEAREAFGTLDTARHRLAAETSALAEVLNIRDGEGWPPMIDRLSVPPGLEGAIGAVLGEEMAAAANPEAARHWRLLPPLQPAALPGAPLDITGPELLQRALNAIGLVQTEAEGDAAQASLQPGQMLVTPAGAVWRWDGYTVRAGAPTAAAVRLQQRNRLGRLTETLGTAERAADTAKQAMTEAVGQERRRSAALAECRQAERTRDVAAARAAADAQALAQQAETALVRLTAVMEQRAQVLPELAAAAAELDRARQVVAAQPDTTLLLRLASEARAAVTAARQRDSAATRSLDTLQRAEQGRRSRILTIARERDDRRMRAADLVGRVTDLRARLADAERDLAQLTGRPASIQAEAAAASARQAEAERSNAEAQSARQAAEALSSTLQAEARRIEQSVYAAKEGVIRAEAAFEGACLGLAAANSRIAEREAALPPLPSPSETSAAAEDRARARLNRLTRERDEIGPVNLRAEGEAAALEAESATIVRECEELGTAIAKLRGSIGHLNREGRERLSAVFQQVDRQFQALFSRMFGGGRAHLALVGSDDPLQAGLEIYAQPPGKALSALSLLSGGEQALTALSLIFAVFRCNPAPLCILDEVDAPLDDANVARFCALLGDMVQETGTRFLVVTHHQVTMAAMDRLYGVTMQERGVSRLLSIDLSGAVDLVETIAAE